MNLANHDTTTNNSVEISRERRVAITALVAVNAMWGCSFPVMKVLNFEVDEHFGVSEFTSSAALRFASSAWMLAIRFGLAFVLFAVVFRTSMRRVQWPQVVAGAVIGAVFYLGMMFQVSGLATIPASRSGFLTSLVVIFTPLVQSVVHRRPPRMVVIVGALIALAGVGVLTGLVEYRGGSLHFADDALSHWTIGDSLTTCAAFIFTGQIMLVDYFGKRHESVGFTPSMFATTSILAVIVFAFIHSWVPEPVTSRLPDAQPATQAWTWWALTIQPRFILLLAGLSVFASLLAFAWMNKYQPVLSAGEASVVYTLEPVFASVWAMVLPGILAEFTGIVYANETLSLTLVIGGGLIMVANAMVLWPQRKSIVEASST